MISEMMQRILVLSLVFLCWVDASRAACGGCAAEPLCTGGEDTAQCCSWDNPAVDTDPASYSDPTRTPLGFASGIIPRVEAGKADPCVTVTLTETNRQTYMQVAVESTSTICVFDTSRPDAKTCGAVVFACNPDGYKGTSSVTFQFECVSGCAAEATLFFRVNIQTVDAVDEYWCDNANMSIPSDLFTGTNTAFTPSDITREPTPASANYLLATPVLLLISVLIATLSL